MVILLKKILLIILFVSLFSLIRVNALDKKQYVIFIDPGHGGFDGGASANSLIEKDIALSISLMVKEYFSDMGIIVYMTRDKDISLNSEEKNAKRSDILNRVNMINASDSDIYISIHLNAFPNRILSGAQTFYKENEQNKILASSIQEAFKMVLGNTKREAKSIDGKYLIDHINKTGCLVEVGFLSNPEEAKMLALPEYQEKISYAIFIGVIKYFSL